MNSSLGLFFGYIFIVVVCWSERAITFYLEQPGSRARYREWRRILIRTGLYGVATVLRLWYMLITMYFNVGLFTVLVKLSYILGLRNCYGRLQWSKYRFFL